MRFYQDHASKQWVIVGELDVWRAVCGEDHVCHFPGSGLVEHYGADYRELPPADFLAETRGTAIADKALELLAAERGCRCFSSHSKNGHWVCGGGKRYHAWGDVDRWSLMSGEDPDNSRHHGYPPTDLPTILASEPGKKHREQIEAFVLSLPVVGETKKVECWIGNRKQTSLLHVGDEWFVIDDSKCRSPKDRVYEAIHAYERSPGPLESCTLPALLDRYSHDPDIVARIRELTGEPAANDEPKERTLLDVVRDVTDAYICERFAEELNRYGATLAEFHRFFVNHVEDNNDAKTWVRQNLGVDRGGWGQRNIYMDAIARRLKLVADEPAAETGEYVEPVQPRETFSMYCNAVYECEIEDCTEAEAVRKLHEMCGSDEFHGCKLELYRPVLIKTLRSVEKTTFEVEEVPCPQ